MVEEFMKIEDFIKLLKAFKKIGHNYVYYTTTFSGSVSAPSKKHNHYRLSYGINKGLFRKDKEDNMLGQLSGFINPIMNMCLILPKNKIIREHLQKLIEKHYQKKRKIRR